MLGEEEEGGEMKDEKGEERDVLVEEIGYAFPMENVTFDRLTKLLPRMEKGVRIKVFQGNGGKFFPLTKTGQELLLSYKMVGFSFMPVMVVEKPSEVESPLPKSHPDEYKRGIEMMRQMLGRNAALGWDMEAPLQVPPLRRVVRHQPVPAGNVGGRWMR